METYREAAQVLAQLAKTQRCSKKQINEAAKKLKIGRTMVYRLLARFRLSEQATSLLPSKPGRKPGAKELGVDQEKVVDRWIRQFYLSRQKPTVAALHRAIARECFQAQIPIPSYKAVRSRLRALDAQEVVGAREGAKAAANPYRPVKPWASASEPLELVQVDHTLVDIIVVDDWERKPIGRPWLSLAIDVATRSVLGFFLSLKTPSFLRTSRQPSLARQRWPRPLARRYCQRRLTWPPYRWMRTGQRADSRAGCLSITPKSSVREPCGADVSSMAFRSSIARLSSRILGDTWRG